jgi:predicted DNA-binding transcriptional regulator AlpA
MNVKTEMQEQPYLLRPGEVAQQLNVSLQTLWRWRQNGTGPAYVKLGKSSVRYLPLKVTAQVAEQ